MRENMTVVRVTYQEKVSVHIFCTVSLVLQNIEQREIYVFYKSDMLSLSKSFILLLTGIIFRCHFLLKTALTHEGN